MTDARIVDTDVFVVGAGPTGGAVAWRLATSGVDVVVADRGGWFDYETLRRDAPDWERRRASTLSSNPNIRRAPADYPVDDQDSPIKAMVGNAVGGGSVFWSAHVPRFRPEDFRIRTLDGVGDDWPIAYEDLAAYYALNEARWGVARIPGDPSAPDQGEEALTLPTIGAHGRRIAAAFDRLGWHWWPVDLVVGRDADAPGTRRCDHVGPCDLGCPSRIRSSAAAAYVVDAVQAGARLLTGTRVTRLEHDAAGRLTHAHCATDTGPLIVRGRRFVVCANGSGTPRLLLASGSSRHEDGLGNGSGLLGRNLMLHPYARTDGLFDGPLGGWARGEVAGLISFEFYATRQEHDFVRGLKLQLCAGHGALGIVNGADTGTRLPWGADHHAAFTARFDHSCGFTVCAEDLAEPTNRIVLSDTLVDDDGMRAPKWTYRVSENSRRILDFGLDRAETVLREAGARATFRTGLRPQAGFHIMGTARMGTDPDRSVVDPFGQVHEVPNLFIADASVFVTAASLNPTATAQALALRTADHLAQAGAGL